MNIMKTCKSCILIHPHTYSRFKIHNMIYHLEWKCLLFSLFDNLIWKNEKHRYPVWRVVCAYVCLFWCGNSWLCFRNKKNILKRMLSLFIWFNCGSFHSLFNEKRLKKNNHERIELWNIAVKITFTLINLSVQHGMEPLLFLV